MSKAQDAEKQRRRKSKAIEMIAEMADSGFARNPNRPKAANIAPEYSGGLGGYIASDPVSAAKGLAVAPFTAAPDILGLLASAGNYGVTRGAEWLTGAEKGTFSGFKPFGQISGDPIREMIGLDPSSGPGMVGEAAFPFETIAKAPSAIAKLMTTLAHAKPGAVAALPLFHGSPFKFDKFDLKAMGLGEGSQMNGHGFYFSMKPDVAGTYQKGLSEARPVIDADISPEAKIAITQSWLNSDFLDPTTMSKKELSEWLKVVAEDTFHELNDFTPEGQAAASALADEILRIKPKDLKMSPGHMYEAEFSDELVDSLLDLDKPLAEQTDSVRASLEDFRRNLEDRYPNQEWGEFFEGTGKDLIHGIEGNMPPEELSATLREYGIPGSRYLDGDSRVVGSGTSNVIIFNPEDLQSVKRDGELVWENKLGIGPPSRKPTEIGAMLADAPLTRKEFYDSFDMHTDLRGREGGADQNYESIMEGGFRQGTFNRLPAAMAEGGPGMGGQYAPKPGDYVYLIPSSVEGKSAGGRPSMPQGWRPGGDDGGIMVQIREGEDLYDAYARTIKGTGPTKVGAMLADAPWKDTTDIPNIDEIARSAYTRGYWREKKNTELETIYMTPDEYIAAVDEGFARDGYGSKVADSVDPKVVERYAREMAAGDKFPQLSLDYRGEFSQEGRHRAMAAKSLGLDQVPVAVRYAADGPRPGVLARMLADAPLPASPGVGAEISTRVPTAVKATEDPRTTYLRPDRASAAAHPQNYENMLDLFRGNDNLPQNLDRASPEEIDDYLQSHMKDNLLFLFDEMPKEIRDRAAQWYVGANKWANELSNRYGITPDQSAAVLAALSPQKDWFQNASLAERVLDTPQNLIATPEMISKAGQIYAKPHLASLFDRIKNIPIDQLDDYEAAMLVRLYDETYNDRAFRVLSPEGDFQDFVKTGKGENRAVAWGSMGEISKAVSAMRNGDPANIFDLLGQQHKVRSFYNNIRHPFSQLGDVTSDTHQVAANLLRPLSGSSLEVLQNLGAGAGSAYTGIKGTYPIHADAVRGAAEVTGNLPREMQSITWEAVRGLFTPEMKRNDAFTSGVKRIWGNYRTGRITADEAREQIVVLAGGIKTPEWARSRAGGNAAASHTSYERGLPGRPVSTRRP